jgi:KDO2-lipid IV(A) lauroyltransferase
MLDFVFYKLAQFLTIILPRRVIYLIAWFVGFLTASFSRKDRRAVIDNLFAITKDRTFALRNYPRVFQYFALNIVDFLMMDRLKRKFFDRFVEVVNADYIKQALSFKKGIIALTAHLGAWELGGALLANHGYPVVALVLDHRHREVTNFFENQRRRQNIEVYSIKHSMRHLLNALSQGKIVAILGDRLFSLQGGIEINFFNHSVLFPKGAAALSIKTESPILIGFFVRKGMFYYQLEFIRPIVPTAQYTTEGLTEYIVKIIEEYIRKYPLQWFMFRRFWDKEANVV